MNKQRILVTGLIATMLATFTLSAPVIARDTASFRFSGIVRTVCRMEFSGYQSPRINGIVDFGTVMQLCNNRQGYRVVMQHPTNMGGATFVLDGQAIPLSNGNETVIVDSARPAFKLGSAQLDVSNVNVPVQSLSFRIEPKGAVF